MEKSTEEEIKLNNEDEEDYDNMFLQPTPAPYNISEKVVEANDVLEKEVEDNNRIFRVTFSQQLVDYEPELTDDDIQSIESYTEEDDFSIAEQPNNFKYIINTTDEIIYEEIEEEVEAIEETIEEIIDTFKERPLIDSPPKENLKKVKSKSRMRKPKKVQHFEINCHRHCVTNIESPLELCINRLNLNERQNCPTLKLHRRTCCEETRLKQKLPLYTGLKSEYGLNSAQIKKQEKYKIIELLKEEKRIALEKEFNRRRIEQNEEIFRQWLRNIHSRKENYLEKCTTRKEFNVQSPERPRTSHKCLAPKSFGKPRPKTTSSCVFIEIPPSALNGGYCKIGNILIQGNEKQLNILSFLGINNNCA